MLLSDKTLKTRIQKAEIVESADLPSVLDNISTAALYLTINKICVPPELGQVKSTKELNDSQYEEYMMIPGETVIVEVNEYLKLPKNLAGLVFPPNRLAKDGLLMTNPGFIDPGFEGPITLCLVNMGKTKVSLHHKMVIARLLFLETDAETSGYQGKPGSGVTIGQINKVGNDFANLNSRVPKLINKFLTTRLAIAFAAVGFFLTAFALILPEVTKYRLDSKKEQTITEDIIEPLKRDLLLLMNEHENNIIRRIEHIEEALSEEN